jgi:hypothetical protein
MDQASSRSKLINPGRSSVDDATAAGTSSRAVGGPQHPFENSKKLLVLLPNDAIDAEAETRLFNELREATQSVRPGPSENAPT